MAIGGGNAEASSSSSRALMGARGKGGDPEILFNRAKSPVAGGSQRAMSPASEGTKGAPSRRVWTVPRECPSPA